MKSSVASSLLFLWHHVDTHAMFTGGNVDLQNLKSCHIHLCEMKPWNTRLQVVSEYTVTGAPAPLNPVEGSRLTLPYSTMLNSTRGPYSKTNVNQTSSTLRQRPRFRALWLARCDASARLLRIVKRSDWMSITEYRKYPSTIRCGWERGATNNTQGLPHVT